MKKSVIISILVGLAIIIAIFLAVNKNEETGLDKVNVRLKWLDQSQFAGFYTAEQKGFYEKNGIDVTLNPGGLDFPAIQMVASGSEQFGVAGADQIILAREKGVPVVALAVLYQQTPLVIFSLEETEIETPSDLIGKRVGVKYGQDEELIYRATLKSAGIDEKKINEEPIKYDLSLLLDKRIDAMLGYSINEPFKIEEESGKKVNLIYPSDYGVHFYADTLFTTEDMIKNNPDLVKRFVIATLQGWEYAYDNPEEAVTYVLMYSDQLERSHETKMMQASLQLLRPEEENSIGSMDRQVWEDMQDLLLENGFLENPIDIDKVYTTQFLE